ncbi:MAG TPA: glycosyltransferase family 4 protein [Steroidobacteraceae bacterium]|nr:glycosyltransferase family 4 protein [Steroidobacteraceae bacterium]
MRILLAAPTFGVHGGIEAFVMALADWLGRNTRHEVRVCFKLVARRAASEALRTRCERLQLDYHFVRSASVELLANLRWAHVVHANNCSPDIVLPAKALGRPVILTIHNWFRGRSGLRNRLWYVCSRIADRRVYNSNFVWSTWEPVRALRGSERMPTVSHLPTATVPFELRRGFCFVARLIANKGLENLVAAYERAHVDKDLWPLYIVGDGPLRPWLESYVRERVVRGVHCLGYVPEEEKFRIIAGCRWLVAPANTREDMGLTPIEARNVAVPAIVTRDGGLPESAGSSALLSEPGDELELQANLERAARMAEEEYRERANSAKQSLNGYLRPLSEYLQIYDILDRKRRGRSRERGLAR